jgi:prolyl 4-hydroxylase
MGASIAPGEGEAVLSRTLTCLIVDVLWYFSSAQKTNLNKNKMDHKQTFLGMLILLTIIVGLTGLFRSRVVPVYEYFEFADSKSVCNNVFYFEMEDFLTHEQCDQLKLDAVENHMVQSKVGEEATVLDKNIRNSEQTWFPHHTNPIAMFIKEKVTELITNNDMGQCFAGVNPNTDFEDVQVVKYGANGKYDPHYDGTECGKDIGPCFVNQRIATILIYLSDDFEGGETFFPNFNVKVMPQKGKALFFWVSDPKSKLVYNETLHGGNPVVSGEKWIATQWIRAPKK